MTTEHTVVRFRQIKKKAVQFKCGRLLANYRDLGLQLPPRAPAAIAPVGSMQPKHAIDGVQFGGLDEFRMRDGDCEERTLERFFPEREEIL